jgi:ATP-dependent Zn protease
MKFATATVLTLLMAEQALAFSPHSPVVKNSYRSSTSSSSSTLKMALDVDVNQVSTPPAMERSADKSSLEMVVKSPGGGPTDVRYSEFLRLVDADKIEKVTFSSDGTQLLGVDVDGTRLKIQSLPNDPDLLSQLTGHKVRTPTTFTMTMAMAVCFQNQTFFTHHIFLLLLLFY